jgi:quinoprotein glucose dehydrogenase
VVHHDLWDYDVASQPTLIEYHGKPAVAVTTKIGNVFVLDRATGKPLHTVEERAVPKSDVAGEDASASQPIPTWSPMVPQKLVIPDSPDAAWCRDKVATLRNDGLFTPPSYKGTISFPGNIGGVNWGSAAWDPVRNLLLANTNRLAAVMTLIPREQAMAALEHPDEMAWRGEFARQRGTPYWMHRDWLVAPSGKPCNGDPVGALVAFDLNTGKLRWEAPLSSVNIGGPMSTAGGLVFTAATLDPNLHAFNSDNGAELWKAELPASAQSTPMTYEWHGKQYVVICAGGHGKMRSKMGDAVVAFRLE